MKKMQLWMFVLLSAFRMVHARKQFKRLQEAATNQRKTSQKKSWKPIMDRKRTSPGTGRKSRSRSNRNKGQGSRSDNSACTSSDNSSQDTIEIFNLDKTENVSESQQVQTSKSSSTFFTSTPTLERSSSSVADVKLECKEPADGKENKENVRKRPWNARGRPHLSNSSPLKRKRSSPRLHSKLKSVAMETNDAEEKEGSGVSPVKKMKTTEGFVVTEKDWSIGDGILSRRRLPKVCIYRLLHELLFTINFYELCLEYIIRPAFVKF